MKMRVLHKPTILIQLHLILLFCLTISIDIVHAATLTVGTGKTYSSIQEAILAASDTDRIEIYSNNTNNIYNESIDDALKDNLTIIGMISNQAITIDGTGIPELSAQENVRISNVNGWHIENITFRDDDQTSLFSVRIAGGNNHTITRCRFSTGGTSDNTYREVAIWDSRNITVQSCSFDGSRLANQKYQLFVQDNADFATIKYNEFAGSNVYVSLWLGTTDNSSDYASVEHNYFHPSFDSNWLGGIYIRDSINHIIKRNLFISDAVISNQKAGAIVLRENATNSIIEHNTFVFPSAGFTSNESTMFIYFDPSTIQNNIIKNNIFQGSYMSINGGEPNTNCPSSVIYNYMFNPQEQYNNQLFSIYSNNTETKSIEPGFRKTGIVWITDGTDEGTHSSYYSLNTGAAAATSGENGTYSGAFSVPDNLPPEPPKGFRIVSP